MLDYEEDTKCLIRSSNDMIQIRVWASRVGSHVAYVF